MEQNRPTESITRFAKHRRGVVARLDEIKVALDDLTRDVRAIVAERGAASSPDRRARRELPPAT
jgi:hypothetical protein